MSKIILTEWKVLTKSILNKDILCAFIGKGQKNVLILSCMHGDEPQGKYISLRLLAYFEENYSQLRDKKLIFVPLVNPDGVYLNKRCNANGVDINRNFPTSNWTLSESKNMFFSGTSPNSEPETQSLVKIINQEKPMLIIALHQPYKIINYDGPAQKYAEELAKYNKYKVVSDIGYPTPGSLGTYAGVENNIPTITLELPESEPDETVWNQNSTGLISIITEL